MASKVEQCLQQLYEIGSCIKRRSQCYVDRCGSRSTSAEETDECEGFKAVHNSAVQHLPAATWGSLSA